ncbi:hypothetical protein U9M48_038906 [Paspalum notatum var. saurae]|uniref:Uncharacterized protein n=1 Tax=Paspalum notatum var. saurae TaxID=547442 RepID=A0AAQ3UMI9_PASNO
MAMSIVVSKSSPVAVRPSSEPKKTSATAVKLSSFDVGLVRRTATAQLVFDHPLHDAAETIKRALSQALVHYYPISGRIVAAAGDDDNDAHIECTGEGVAFVAASANCALKEATAFFNRSPGARTTTTVLDELAVDYPGEGCGGGPTDPLVQVQVTEFSCGGFVLGVTWNHGIADGTGMAQFLQAVGELARGLPSPSVAPVRWDDALPSLPISVAALEQLATSLEPLDLARLGIAVPSSLIRRIKAESGERRCTTFEAVAAVLWRCRTRAIVADPNSLALLSFPANVRRHVGAMDGYYGNCITQQLVMATAGAVARAEIAELVGMIRCAKEEIAGQLANRGSGDYDQLLQAVDLEQIGRLQYGALNVSSWRNLGFDNADFGAGTPAKVMCYGKALQTLPLCVIGLPCKGGDDGQDNVFSVCVKQEHVDAFLKELASLA